MMPRLPDRVTLLNATVPLWGLTVVRDLAYGTHPRHAMDVYRPLTPGGRLPVLVWFYGGAWQSGRRQDYRFVAAALARRGMVVAVPDYRLNPEVRYPDFLHDAAAAVATVRHHAAGWGGDAGRIILAGHSAGAYIAAMLTLDRRWLGAREGIAGAVGLAGPYDFLPIHGPEVRAVFAAAPDWAQTQPVSHADGSAPPLLLLHGSHDRVCDPRNSLSLAGRIRAAGGVAEALLYPRIGHVGIVLGFVPWLARCATLPDLERFVNGSLSAAPQPFIQPAA